MLAVKFLNDIKSLVPIIANQKIKEENMVVVLPKNLPNLLYFLKNHIAGQYKILSCISGVDFLGKDYRFCVAYDLLSLIYSSRIRVKVFLNEITPVPSVVNIYINANWWEREVWDLFGIFFENHPDMRRILSDYGFEGYPMRKDFPLYGYIELRYDETQKRIVAEPVEFAQEFRFFDFETPW
jgi:NADH dehydrogenase (ubiquinone) Fe-S protein 3